MDTCFEQKPNTDMLGREKNILGEKMLPSEKRFQSMATVLTENETVSGAEQLSLIGWFLVRLRADKPQHIHSITKT